MLGWQIAERCFVEEARTEGIATDTFGSPGANAATADQLRYIEQAVAGGADGIMSTSFTNGDAVEAAFQAARDKGIYVGTMASGDTTEARNFDVGIDIVQFGKDMADQVASQSGTRRVAIVVQSLTGTPKEFTDAFTDQARKHDNLELVQTVTDDGVVTKDAELVSGLLSAHPDITDIVSAQGGSTAGITTAIRERGKQGEVMLTGNSIADPAPASLEDGSAYAFYIQKKCDLGRLAVQNMVALSKGENVARNIPIETGFVTVKNYKELDLEVWN